MKITFTVVGRNGDKAIEDLIDRYLKRLTHYVRFDVRQIADVKIPKSATNEMQ
ncbi:MAG: 23S rRNA (pseudouridine(1915)-N(3))-methyltransferase RlmH, partial [Muribaculaceae bacterium]|nr:23S rRNA (pseudouridine(1915)-N(3))-methyltransferase RlmH [Muribaculaceae bacterium]